MASACVSIDWHSNRSIWVSISTSLRTLVMVDWYSNRSIWVAISTSLRFWSWSIGT